MTADRRTRITIERERVLIVAQQPTTRAWCERCGMEVNLVQQGQADRPLGAGSLQMSGEYPGQLQPRQGGVGLARGLQSILRFLKSAGSRHISRSKED